MHLSAREKLLLKIDLGLLLGFGHPGLGRKYASGY